MKARSNHGLSNDSISAVKLLKGIEMSNKSGAKILEESEKAEKEDTSKEVLATRSVVYTLRKTGIPVKVVTDAEAASDYGDELTLSDGTIYGYTDGDDGRETH